MAVGAATAKAEASAAAQKNVTRMVQEEKRKGKANKARMSDWEAIDLEQSEQAWRKPL